MFEAVSGLMWTRPLERRQSASSFAARLGSLHGREASRFLFDMGISPRAVYFGDAPAVEALAQLGGCDATRLAYYTPRVEGQRRFSIGGADIGDAVLRMSFRYCPLCIEEDLDRFDGPVASRPWLRFDWQIDQVRACSLHRLLLIDAVPERVSARPIDISRELSSSFSRLHSLASAQERVSATGFQDWVMRRIDGEVTGTWLDRLTLPVGIRFCEGLGGEGLFTKRAAGTVLTTAERARAAEEGFRVASGGEDSIRAYWETFRARQHKPGVWGMIETFGGLYLTIQRRQDHPEWQIPRDLLRDFAVDTIPFAMGTVILGKPVAERRTHTICNAMTEAGRYGDFVRRMLERKGYITADSAGLSDHKIVLDASVLAETIAEIKSAIPMIRAATLIGLTARQLRRVIKLDMIPTVGDTNQIDDAVHWLTPDAIEAFRQKAFAGAVEIAEKLEGHVTIKEA